MANSILIKVNQIGTLTETLRGDRDGARGRLHGGHEPPLGRDRGRDDRRPRGGDRLRADQDRRARRARTGWPSTTSCCGSRSSWASDAQFPGRARVRAAACSSAAASAGRRSAGGRECVRMPSRLRRSRPPGAPRASALARRAPGARAGARRAARVRWDRLGRVAMLFVLVALVYLYLSAGVHMLSTWRQARGDSAAVATHGARTQRCSSASTKRSARRGTLEAEARQLGMMQERRAAVHRQRPARQLRRRAAQPALLASARCRSRTRSTSGSRASGGCRPRRRAQAAARAGDRRAGGGAAPAPGRALLGGGTRRALRARHRLVPAGRDEGRPGGSVGVGAGVVVDAAFARYLREAADYAGGAR